MARAKKQPNRVSPSQSINLTAAALVVGSPAIGAPVLKQAHRLKTGHKLRAANLSAGPPIIPTMGDPAASMAPPAGTKRRKGSRAQEMIRRMCNEEWPAGYEDIETAVIIDCISRKLRDPGKPVPKYDVFLRALGRRS